ncbi:MAG: T9SS type A sorting domain-containing protein [Chitinophagales bacterium]|nr:T9SS type A sorting domain-containing protein [Chitinophagales bacterium]
MKRTITIPLFLTLFLVIGSAIFFQYQKIDGQITHDGIASKQEEEEKKERDAKAYLTWLNSMRVNPATGKLDFNEMYQGKMQVMEAIRKGSTRGGSLLNLVWEELGPNNVGGRTRAIAFDKDDANRMYAGSVSGGLFITENGGLDWYPSPGNETLGSLLIATIGVAANGDIYIGTGEDAGLGSLFDGSQSFTHSFTGDGIYKSTDKGVSFTLLTETQPTPTILGSSSGEDWAYVNRIACHPTDANTVFAAINGGLKYTTDGGTTWNFCTEEGDELDFNKGWDVAFDSDGNAHAIYGFKFYKSTSSASPSEMVQLGEGLPTTGIGRIVLAVAPSDPNYVYLYFADSGTESELIGIYRSTDGGANFTAIAPEASVLFNPPGAQGTWNLCIAVNPSDKDKVYIGGQISSYTWRASSEAWTEMTNGFFPEFFSKYLHADHHTIVFHPTDPNIMYFGSDGGISRTLNAMSDYPDFGTLNKGYNVTQFHGVGFGMFGDPVGGTQDNGSPYINFLGNNDGESIEVTGGDGGKGEVSKIRPEYVFTEIYFAALRRSVNGGITSSSPLDCNIDFSGGGGAGCSQDGNPDLGGDFVAEFKLWENWPLYKTFKDVLYGDTVEYPVGSGDLYSLNDSVDFEGRTVFLNRTGLSESRLYLATNANLWVTNGALFNSTEAAEWFRVMVSTIGFVSAVEFDNTGDIVYVGTSSGRLYRLEGLLNASFEYVGDTWNAADAGITSFLYPELFGGRITGISIDRNDADHVVLSIGGYGVDDNVWHSADALADSAATFVSVADNLPNIPVFDVEMRRTDHDVILAATEFGIWSYDVSVGGDWTQESDLIGNVPVFEIREDWIREEDCYAIYIGTHGRGFFRATNLSSTDCDFTLRNDSVEVSIDAGPIQEEIIAGITVAPNPADVSAEITMTLLQPVSVDIKLYNMSGLMMKNYGTISYPAGTHKYTADVHTLLPGSYLIVLDIEGILVSRKLMVI